MIFSELWLREWLYIEKAINFITEQLSMSGLQTDSIMTMPIPYYISKPIIGHIYNYKRASKENRYIYSVDIGYKRLIYSFCSNCIEHYVCFNIVIAISGSDSVSTLSKSKNHNINYIEINGVRTKGKLWGLSDINISYSSDRIIKLPLETNIGSGLCSYLRLNDNIIKVNVAPNKTHCSNILGIARELSCLNNIALKYPTINYVNSAFDKEVPTLIEPNRVCPCFVVRIINNININIETPLWIKEKLSRCGIILDKVLNDITTYVLLELGQPINIFDFNAIKERLAIRLSKANEVIYLYNGVKIALNSKALIISDEVNILSLVGISKTIAGKAAINTTNIILSALYINPSFIIGKAHYRFSLCSNHINYYERGVDYNILFFSIERTSGLISSICGGYVSSLNRFRSSKDIIKSYKVGLHRYKLNKLIGFLIPDRNVNSILTSLNYKAFRVNADWKVLIPSWRFNINIEEDLIEEAISFYGVSNINKKPISSYLVFTEDIKDRATIKRRRPLSLLRIKELLIDRGYQEVVTYSFIDAFIQNNIYPKIKSIYIKNPIAKEMNVVRSSLLVGLIKTLTYNLNHQQRRVRLFESGFCFRPDNNIGLGSDNNIGLGSDNNIGLGFKQNLMVAGLISGSNLEEHWDNKARLVDFYDIKGDLECIFVITNKTNEVELKPINNLALHPNQSVAIFYKDKYVGLFGAIHPKLQLELNIEPKAYIFEFFCERLLDYIAPKDSNIGYFPISRRSISIVVSKDILVSAIISELSNIKAVYLVIINASDVYYDNIKEGFKSLSIRFYIQSTDKPLKEYDINLVIKAYVDSLKQKFNAYLR